jgi:hypothetical protein
MIRIAKIACVSSLVGALVLLSEVAAAAPIPFSEAITKDAALSLNVTVSGGPITEAEDDAATAGFAGLNFWDVTVELSPDDGIEDDQLDVDVTVFHRPFAAAGHSHAVKGEDFKFKLSIDAEDADVNRNVSDPTADFVGHDGHFDFYSAVLSGVTDPNDAEDELISWKLNIVGTHCAGATAGAGDPQCQPVPAPSAFMFLAPSPLLFALLVWRRRRSVCNGTGSEP